LSDTDGETTGTIAVRSRVAALILLMLLVTGAASVFAVQSNNDRMRAALWERHTFQVQLASQRVRSTLSDTEAAQRGYLLAQDASYLARFWQGSDLALSELARLRAMTRDNPRQQDNIIRLTNLVHQRLAILRSAVELNGAGNEQAAIAYVRAGRGKRVMEAAQAVLGEIDAQEQALLERRTAELQRGSSHTFLSIVALMLVGAVLLVLAGWAAVRALRDREAARTVQQRLRASQEVARARDFLQMVIDRCIDPIMVKDRAGRFTVANDRAAEIYGTTKSEMIGRRAGDFLPATVAEVLETAGAEVMKSGEAKVVEEHFNERGTQRVYQISKTPWHDDGDHVAGIIAVAHDVTDRKANEDQLRSRSTDLAVRVQERTREVEEVSAQVRQLQKMDSLGQLTGGIAHDFNNMLAIVIGSLDLATRRLDTNREKALACIENAKEGARRAAVLTARLLAFSRQQPLEPEPIQPNQLVGGMSEMLRRTIGEDLRVETVLAGGLWRVYADASQLENALLNLCVNSRDAMPDGGRLTIETSNAHLDETYADAHAEVTAGQYVLVAVTDTGTGNGTLDPGVAFLPKPFSLDALALKIRQVLDGVGVNRPRG
jgi:PAS domain S-box-containing protein